MTRTMRTSNLALATLMCGFLGSASAVAAELLPERLSQTGLYADRDEATRPGRPGFLAAISAVERRRAQAALDRAASGNEH